MKPKRPKRVIRGLMGVGLDNQDGHQRITTGDKFAILGGSEETHGQLTETALKTFEALKRRGKAIDEVEVEELAEIIQKAAPS